MSAVSANVVEFRLPRKPKVKEREPEPDRRTVSVLPIRAVFDQKLTHGGLQVLAAICSFANRAGITWVSQTRLAKDLGISQQAVSKQVRQLRELGYLETIRKGFKGVRNDTIRVIFDPTVDAATAIAVTSSVEDTRPPEMRKEQQMQQDNTVDPEGLKRIQDMIKGVVKPVQPPPKTYQMPKGDTITVAKMKAEIAAKKAKKTSDNHNPQVVTAEPLHSQPDHNLGVVQNAGEHLLTGNCKKIIERELKVIFKDNKLLEVLNNLQLTDSELVTACQTLSERYQSEGLAIPASEDQLVHDLVMIAVDAS